MSIGERIYVCPAGPNSVGWISTVLLRQGMPEDEVRRVLLVDDPEMVRRHLELHRERLTERMNDELGTIDVIERFLSREWEGGERRRLQRPESEVDQPTVHSIGDIKVTDA